MKNHSLTSRIGIAVTLWSALAGAADFEKVKRFWARTGAAPDHTFPVGQFSAFHRYGANGWSFGPRMFNDRVRYDIQIAMANNLVRRDDVLLLSSHGLPPEFGALLGSARMSDPEGLDTVDPEEVATFLATKLSWSKYKAILLLSCHGDDAGDAGDISQTFAARLARATGLPVVAATGLVHFSVVVSATNIPPKAGRDFEYWCTTLAGPLPPNWKKEGMTAMSAFIQIGISAPQTPPWRVQNPPLRLAQKQVETVDSLIQTLSAYHQDPSKRTAKWLAGSVPDSWIAFFRTYLEPMPRCRTELLNALKKNLAGAADPFVFEYNTSPL